MQRPASTCVAGVQQASISHAHHDALSVGRYGHRRQVQTFRQGQVAGPGQTLVLREPQTCGACDGHLAGCRSGNVAPGQRLPKRAHHAFTFRGHHQAELHARERKAQGIVIKTGHRAAVETRKGLQIAAAHRQHIVRDLRTIAQGECAGGFFKTQRATSVEETAQAKFHIGTGTQQGAFVTLNVQDARGACACPDRQGLGLEIGHQIDRVQRGRQAVHLIDLHQNFAGLQGQCVHAHETDRIGLNLQAHPADTWQQGGFQRAGQNGQSELGVLQGKTGGIGVGRIVILVDLTIAIGVHDDLAIAIAVHKIRATHAGKHVQARPPNHQRVHQRVLALHANALGGFLKAQRSTRGDEVGHTEFEITRGTDQLAKAAVDRKRHLAGFAGIDVDRRFIELGQLFVGIARGALHEVDDHFQVLCIGSHAGHTHHGHLPRRGLHGNPAARAAALVEQRQTEFDIAQRQADGIGVGVVCERDAAVTIGIAAVRTAHPSKTTQTGTADADHVGHDFLAVGQLDGPTGFFQRQRAAGREKARNVELHAARGSQQIAPLAFVRQTQALAGAGHDLQRLCRSHEVDHLVVGPLRTRLVQGQVGIDRQIEGADHQFGRQAQKIDLANAGGQGHPAVARLVCILRAHQGQAELDITHAQANRLRVDLVAVDLAVVVGVGAIRAQAHKACQARAAHGQCLHLHRGLVLVGQLDGLGASLEAHRT